MTPAGKASRYLASGVLFWAGDALAVWLALAAFGFVMNGAALIVGYATGMVFTRRTAPQARSGTLILVLPLTIRASGAPLAIAITGVWAYRLLCFWLALPPALRLDRLDLSPSADPPSAMPPAPERMFCKHRLTHAYCLSRHPYSAGIWAH